MPETVIYSDEILIHPKPADNNENIYIDPKKRGPFTVKVEAPNCSSSDEEPQAAAMPVGPIKAKKCQHQPTVKGLHVCQVCGQDYTNKLDLANHMGQHVGVEYTCEKCEKKFYSHKSFENHTKAHTEGPHVCSQCQQNFELKSSLLNHLKKHKGMTYACQVEPGCPHTMKSYAMFLEHFHYGHLDEKMIPCDYCSPYFQTPTNMMAHRNKAHGPAPKNQ